MASVMKIFSIVPENGYELCHPIEQDGFENFNAKINGMRRAADWQPIAVKIIQEDEDVKLLTSDAPWLGSHALILRENAVIALRPLLMEFGELLPLTCDKADLVVFNPTSVLNAVDEDASSITRFSNGRIMHISRYAFFPEVVYGADIFKISNLRVSPTFVSQRFVAQWKSSHLRGLEFREV
ncbi:imm11 family protein [Collimonas arenae]|uniref:imm11 family protein n=1 Tax=Collimonas arenae TaxID=279058 RepID=UPI00056DCAA1|nr:DUF1629 domain-containing protein [Collimonas arenae]